MSFSAEWVKKLVSQVPLQYLLELFILVTGDMIWLPFYYLLTFFSTFDEQKREK